MKVWELAELLAVAEKAQSDEDGVDFDEDPDAADALLRGNDGREWKSDTPAWE